ncbi:MAG: DeoR family transcriptional regulator [Candidatus Omnitrophota bacterium]
MVRNTDYESRRRAVLASTINRYIKDATPVASDDIAEEFHLSPATIRNIFSELEENGYITHPYTSGGRIPTNKGYRYYVDFLLSEIELLNEEKDSIVREYRSQIRKLDDVLEKTSEILSGITHYAGIVSFLQWHDRLFYRGISFILEQPEFQDVTRMRLLINMIEGKKSLLDIVNRDFEGKVKVYIGEELGYPEIKNCSLAVSSYSVKKKPSGRVAVLGPMRMQYQHIIPTLHYVSDVLTEALEDI